jgi:hypothetical protein
MLNWKYKWKHQVQSFNYPYVRKSCYNMKNLYLMSTIWACLMMKKKYSHLTLFKILSLKWRVSIIGNSVSFERYW